MLNTYIGYLYSVYCDSALKILYIFGLFFKYCNAPVTAQKVHPYIFHDH